MYPGLPSRLEKEIRELYLREVAKGDTAQLDAEDFALFPRLFT